MKLKLFIIELVMGIVIATLIYPTLYTVNEVYIQLFSTEPYEFKGTWFAEIGLITIFSIMNTFTMIISVLIFHIPISFYLRNRFAKPKFKFLSPIIIALSTYFMVVLMIILIYFVMLHGIPIKNIGGLFLYFGWPSFLPILLPPLLTALIFGKTFEYCES